MDVQVGVPPPPPPPPPPAFFGETTAPPTPVQPVTTAPTTTTTANVTSPPTQDRIWLHPWTVNEMRDHASKWSLAGDAGVLLYLEQFSERLTQRADAIQQHINQTVNAVKSTHTRVLNSLNEFTSLANTQFIENRVYDEDETVNSTTDASKKDDQSADKNNVNNTEAQEKVLQRYAEAIQYGLSILDTHFERVETKSDNHTNGGSFVEDEEETNGPQEPILEPKDPYILRPLPFLIGGSDFMQDDYIGLGDLRNEPEEESIDAQQIANVVESDSELSSLDEGEDGEDDFKAEVAPAIAPSIAPAGAPISDLSKPQQSSKTHLTDSSEDEDDPFGLGKNVVSRIDSDVSKPVPTEDDFFDDEPIKPKSNAFTFDSDEEEDNSFDVSTKPLQSNIKPKDDNDGFNDSSSTTSDKPEEPEPPKPKVMSELEKAVLRRAQKMGGPDAPVANNDGNDDDDDDGFGIKRTPTKTKPSSNAPSSSTIFNLTSQPLTAPPKNSQPSIFGENEDDDDNDIFNPKANLPSVLSPVTKSNIKPTQTKEKDMFDDDSDEEDIFSPKQKSSTPSSQPAAKKPDPIPSQPTVVNKPKPIVLDDVSDEDDLFGAKPSVIPTPAANKEDKSSHSTDSDDMFNAPVSKPPLPPVNKTPAANVSDDEDSAPTVKTQETKVTHPPVVLPTLRKPRTKLDSSDEDESDDDDDDKMFGIPPKKSLPPASSTATPPSTQKVLPTATSDNEDVLFGTPKAPPAINKVLPTNLPKPKPPVVSDSDDELFPSKPSTIKPPSSVVSPPSVPTTKSNVSDDPLTSGVSVGSTPPPVVQQTKPSSIPARKSVSSDNEEESSTSDRVLNPGALQDGEKITNVKAFAARLQIKPSAFGPPGLKPPTRPKASSITEEPPTSPIEEVDQPVENKTPAPTVTKKIPTLDSGSDDEALFGPTIKKETPKPTVVEQKEKPTNTNESGKNNIKALSAGLNFTRRMPGAQPKPPPKETNNDTQAASKDEPVIDKTMNNMLRDKAKAGPRRAPPSKRTRPTAAAASSAAAAASIDDDDDLFATPKPTTNTTKSPPTPAAAATSIDDDDDFFAKPKSTTTTTKSPPAPVATPIVPPPSVPAPVVTPPVVTPPSVPAPVTGLPDKSAAIAAKRTNLKEKKKFSLFDSDDSDTDELLFGSSTKKDKSSVTPKATTTTAAKSTTKAPALALDDDDDFLSRRPQKKTTKPVVNDEDIFADVKSKGQPGAKAKKDWSLLEGIDDTVKDTPKSSSASKSKPTNGKTKPSKISDDIFD